MGNCSMNSAKETNQVIFSGAPNVNHYEEVELRV